MLKKIAISLCFILIVAACQKKQEDTLIQKMDLTLQTSKGAPINVSINNNKFDFTGFEGKPLLVVFFATWCPPCKAEMPELAKIKTEYDGKINILAVLTEQDKNPKELEAFIKERGINFPVTVSNENFQLATAVGGVNGIPASFMFDSNGSLVKRYSGAVPSELLKDDFNKLLK